MSEPPNDGATGTLADLHALAEELQATLDALLEHSDIHYDDVNARSSGAFFVGWNPHRWSELDGPGQAALGKARDVYRVWAEHTAKAIAVGAPERQRTFDGARGALTKVLRLESKASSGAPASTVDAVRQKVAEALSRQRKVLAELPTAHGEGGRLLVPDTNAMLYQPNIEDWQPAGEPLTFVIVPQVIRELDQKKLGEKPVAAAANTCIRKLKEYGRRGETITGVPIRPGVQLREVPVDADMSNTLSWLRAGHEDDELLASLLELKWRDLSAEVVLVTRDRNLQNKARFARVNYIDVEAIAAPRPSRPTPKPAGNPEADQAARERLGGSLAFATAQLAVPPANRATQATEQSWTVLATPVSVPATFAQRVLGPEAATWFAERVGELHEDPVPVAQSPPAPQMGARGFSVRRSFVVPQKGSVLLVADSGGVVGARCDLEIDPPDQRLLLLHAVEDEYLRPLSQACVDALEYLTAEGPALIDAWAIGLSRFQVSTAGHPTLRSEPDGWLNDSIHHIGREISIPATPEDIDRLVNSWGRELARAAGIPAWEKDDLAASERPAS